MACWADNGIISRDPIPGGIEISEEQYGLALAGMMAGKTVSIDGGLSVEYPPEPEVPEPQPEIDPPHKLYKSTLIRRLTEQEAVALTALLKSSPVKMQMLWDASEYLVSDDPLFDDLTMAISGALGEDRASEILGEDK